MSTIFSTCRATVAETVSLIFCNNRATVRSGPITILMLYIFLSFLPSWSSSSVFLHTVSWFDFSFSISPLHRPLVASGKTISPLKKKKNLLLQSVVRFLSHIGGKRNNFYLATNVTPLQTLWSSLASDPLSALYTQLRFLLISTLSSFGTCANAWPLPLKVFAAFYIRLFLGIWPRPWWCGWFIPCVNMVSGE